MNVAEKLTELFSAGGLHFDPIDLEKLHPNTLEYIQMIVPEAMLATAQVAREVVDGHVTIKFDHPQIVYLVHEPASRLHIWGDPKFDNLDGNWVLVEFAVMGGHVRAEDRERAKEMLDSVDTTLRRVSGYVGRMGVDPERN